MEFNKNVNDVISKNAVNEFQWYRDKYVDETESEISDRRQNDYAAKCGEYLNKIYGDEYAYIINKNKAETPMTIVDSILSKIEKLKEQVDNNKNSEVVKSDDFIKKVKLIIKNIGAIKQDID